MESVKRVLSLYYKTLEDEKARLDNIPMTEEDIDELAEIENRIIGLEVEYETELALEENREPEGRKKPPPPWWF